MFESLVNCKAGRLPITFIILVFFLKNSLVSSFTASLDKDLILQQTVLPNILYPNYYYNTTYKIVDRFCFK